MLDLALVRSEPARVQAALGRRGVPPDAVETVVDLDRRWSARHEMRETLRTRRRQISREVDRRRAGADAVARPADAGPDLVRVGRDVARDLKAVDHAMADLASRRQAALLALPNLPATDVPLAPPAVEAAGPPWRRPFPPLAHWDLLEMLHMAEPAGASAGRGFLLWRGEGARLVRGLIAFLLDAHTADHGRDEVRAPPLATRGALTGSAHLPTLEGMLVEVVDPSRDRSLTLAAGAGAEEKRGGSPHPPREADLYLSPRAEPHLAALYANTVVAEPDLPVRLVAAGTAFRRDSRGGGAAGRGLLRLRAFPTVEVYTLCRPAESDAELDAAVADAEGLLGRLGLACRRRVRAATNLSHAAARTVSLDVWCPGLPERGAEPPFEPGAAGGLPASAPRHSASFEAPQPERSGDPSGQWVEVAALSSFTDYQARRVGARYRDAAGRVRHVHTVGGASVALPRLIAALIETGQEADGSVRLPPALAGHVGLEVLGAP